MQTLIDINQRLDQILEGRPHLGAVYAELRGKYGGEFRKITAKNTTQGSYSVFTRAFMTDTVLLYCDKAFRDCVMASYNGDEEAARNPYTLFKCVSSPAVIRDFVSGFPIQDEKTVTAQAGTNAQVVQISIGNKSIMFETTRFLNI